MYPIFSTVNLQTRLRRTKNFFLMGLRMGAAMVCVSWCFPRYSRESPAGSAGSMVGASAGAGAGEEYGASEASGRGRRGFVLRATFWPCLTSSSMRTERNLRTLSERRILRCTSATHAAGARKRKLWYVVAVLFLTAEARRRRPIDSSFSMVAPLSTRSLRNSSTTAWVPASSFSGTMSRTMSYWRCGFGVVTRFSSFWIAPVSAGREARLWTSGPVPSQGCGSVRRGGFLGQTVETVHGDVDSLGHEDGESVYRRRDRLVHDGAFLLREAREHVRVEGLAGLEVIAAHAEAQARDEVRPEAVDHGLQALLAAGGARAPEAEGSDRERRVVGDDEETVKRDVVLRREALHGLPRGVHVGLGPGHDHGAVSHLYAPGERAAVEPVETGRTA